MKYLLANKKFYTWRPKWYLEDHDENNLKLSRGPGLVETSSLKKNGNNYIGTIPIIVRDGLTCSVKDCNLELKCLGEAEDYYPISLASKSSKVLAYDLIIQGQVKNKQPLILIDHSLLNDFFPSKSCTIV